MFIVSHVGYLREYNDTGTQQIKYNISNVSIEKFAEVSSSKKFATVTSGLGMRRLEFNLAIKDRKREV